MKNTKLEFTFCHRRPDRSFFWRNRQFPVCARCTGIHLGYLSFPLFLFDIWTLSIWWTMALMFPTIFDGLTQAFWNRESNNWLRLSTGLLAGVGMMSLVGIIGYNIGIFILFIIQPIIN